MRLQQLFKRLTETMPGEYDDREKRAAAYRLVRFLTGYDRHRLIADPDLEVSPDETKLRRCLEQLRRHAPVEYITGEAFFFGRSFLVTPDVLSPRPETEELTERILSDCRGRKGMRVADFCTGSGCIAVTLALELEEAEVTGLDISLPALRIARQNAERLNARTTFRQADALRLPAPVPAYDLIVSNPPYVLEREKAEMRPNVLEHEPHTALFVPDDDPLRFYDAIGHYAFRALRPGGRLYFEINETCGTACARLLEQTGFTDVERLIDLFGKERFIRCRRPLEPV